MTRRIAVALVVVLFSTLAGAQDWHRINVESLAISFEVPPGFRLTEHTGRTDLLVFQGQKGEYLGVGASLLPSGDFNASLAQQMKADEKGGWQLTYRRSTPDWVSYSGLKNGQIRYARAIRTCGQKVAVFVLDYAREDKLSYDAVVTRMVRSLRRLGC